MPGASNFDDIRINAAETSLRVRGNTKETETVTAVFASVVARPEGDARVPKFSEKQGAETSNAIVGDWEVDIPIERGTFHSGDRVLLAGAALRDEPDVWIDSLEILPPFLA